MMKWFRKLSPHERIDRAERAKKELEVTREAFQAVGEDLFKKWAQTREEDHDLREHYWRMYCDLSLVETKLHEAVSDGALARLDAEEEQ